jgi:toxin ParE1/3/4
MKVEWSPLATDRVVEIAAYIAREYPDAAEAWIRRIFTRAKQLERFPNSGRRVRESSRKDIRELVWGNYRIIHRLGKTSSSILTVRHTKQILPVEDIA